MKLSKVVKTAGKLGVKVFKFNLKATATLAVVGAVVGAVDYLNQRQQPSDELRARALKSKTPLAQVLRITDSEGNTRFTYHILTLNTPDSIIEKLNHLMCMLNTAYGQLKQVEANDSDMYYRWATEDRKYLNRAVDTYLLSSLIDLSRIDHITKMIELSVDNVQLTYDYYLDSTLKRSIVDTFSTSDVDKLIDCVHPELREECKEFIEA